MGRKNDSLGTRVFSCIMSIVLAVGLMPLPAFAEAAGETAASGDLVVAEAPLADSLELTTSSGEQAQDSHVGVRYIQRSWNGKQVVDQPRNISAIPVPTDGSMTGGTFYLDRSVTVDGRICLTDDTDLILGDGRTLNVKGLYIPKGKTLNIYCQSAGTGKLVSQPDDGTAIGAYSGHKGGSVVIHGGNIEATGAKNCAGIGSNDGDGKTSPIVILGGKVTANGGSMGAGIGGGKNCDAGEITIYGGNVTAKGGEDGAGIGGGEHGDGGTITIYGGTVNANKDETNENGAGIGGGDGGEGGTITINGGTVNTWSRDGAGIGGGEDGDGGTITINDGIVECADKGVAQGARIGGGNNGDGGPGSGTARASAAARTAIAATSPSTEGQSTRTMRKAATATVRPSVAATIAATATPSPSRAVRSMRTPNMVPASAADVGSATSIPGQTAIPAKAAKSPSRAVGSMRRANTVTELARGASWEVSPKRRITSMSATWEPSPSAATHT